MENQCNKQKKVTTKMFTKTKNIRKFMLETFVCYELQEQVRIWQVGR